MKRSLYSLICVLLVFGVCIFSFKTSESVIAGPPQIPDAPFLKAKLLQLRLSTMPMSENDSILITNPKLVLFGDELFVAGNDHQQLELIRHFSLRHIVEIVQLHQPSE